MIYVIDAIMGSGKTSACINFMNAHCKDRRFLYIVPYNDETERIKRECPALDFVLPSNSSKDTGYRKTNDAIKWIKQRRNIAMTHELYCRLTPDVIDEIASAEYTVFIDEVINVFDKPDYNRYDIDIAINEGLLVKDPVTSTEDYVCYKTGDNPYKGTLFTDLVRYGTLRQLVKCNNVKTEDQYVCWMLHPQLFSSSVDAYVMTYMFDGSPMKAFFEVNHIKYSSIGVRRTPDGYAFDARGEVPEYTTHIRDMIEICDHRRLNKIGDPENALSMKWYADNCKSSALDNIEPQEGKRRRLTDDEKTGADWLRGNLYSFFNYYSNKQPKECRLWSTYKGYEGILRGKGYYRCSAPWNQKSTNKYIEKTALAYTVNLYMNPSLKTFFDSAGAGVTHEQYALSIMIQWIWRSAIRRGQKVYLYLPSSRMRRLLNQWMDSLEAGDVSGDRQKLAS